MKKSLLLLTVWLTATGLQAQSPEGNWYGKLSLGIQKLGIALQFATDNAGKSKVTMDVPEQGIKALPADVLLCSPDSVSLNFPVIGASYTGRIAGTTLNGLFHQNGLTLPLKLEKQSTPQARRPQEPQPPLPYTTEEVVFTNPAAGVSLAGTLTYPVGYKQGDKVKAVLMVSGSGTQNRDEEILEHKPFLVMADFLARNGIASLRYDDRGAGKSTGRPDSCTTADFAADAQAGMEWLKRNKGWKTGVLGHSEGGTIAFMIGAKGQADFIVSMGGVGIKGDSLLAEQRNALARLNNAPGLWTAEKVRAQLAAAPANPWFDFFINYDPAADVRQTKVPVMAINGSKDMQVLPGSNLQTIRQLLHDGNRKNLFKEYPGLNHLFQHCTTGSPTEYYHIEETLSPEVMCDIAGWINAL